MKKLTVLIASLALAIYTQDVAKADTTLSCTTNDHRVVVEQTGYSTYKYIAWDRDSNEPSLVLKGGHREHSGGTGDYQVTSYIFYNGDYTYQVSTNGQVGNFSVIVSHGGEQIYNQECN